MKKLLALFLFLVFISSALSVLPFASPQDGKTAVKTIVAIGDSIASGYMLPDYDPQIPRPRSETSAPVTLADKIGYELVDMSKEGTTTKSVLENQFSEEYEEYVIDPETMWFITGEDGKRLSYTFDNRANLERLKTADIVTVSVGNYDLVSFFSMKNNILDKVTSGEITNITEMMSFMNEIWDEIDTKTTQSAENLKGVFQKIRSFNPNATIAFQNLYNTYEQVDVTLIKEFVRIITLTLNSKTEDVCKAMDVMYVDVYAKFYHHKDEDLINMDCDSLMDYINGNYQNDSHPTTLGHKYIMETYYDAFEEADILPKYTGSDVDAEYSFTRNEAAEGVDKALPNTIVIKSTHGDYKVKVKQWVADSAVDLTSTSEQTIMATALLDEATVPDFIRNVEKIETKVTVTGAYTPPPVETEPPTPITTPVTDVQTEENGTQTDSGTDSPANTGDDAPIYGPGVSNSQIADGTAAPSEDTEPSETAETAEQSSKPGYEEDPKVDDGSNKALIFIPIGLAVLAVLAGVIIYLKKTRY